MNNSYRYVGDSIGFETEGKPDVQCRYLSMIRMPYMLHIAPTTTHFRGNLGTNDYW
jgi:hypothetical protein